MRRWIVLVAVVLLALSGGPGVQDAGAAAVGSGGADDAGVTLAGPSTGADLGAAVDPDECASEFDRPHLRSIYPNPLADDDLGESVLVCFPEPTDATGWTLVDDAGHVATLPNATLAGDVRLSPEPDAATDEASSSVTTRPLGGRLRLANGGDAIELRRPNGSDVDRRAYDRAPEGDRLRRIDGVGWQWRPLGATSHDPVETTPRSATAFVLPDAPEVVERELRDADRRILLAGYTLSSDRVADALVDAHARGVDVRVLVEGSPVGGTDSRQVEILDRLADAGVPVTVLGGEDDPFRYHHAKYAVVDDRAIVLSENWKPSGTGGQGNRGWGAVVSDEALAAELAGVFEADRTGAGSANWSRYRDDVDPVATGAASASYPSHHGPATVPVERARLLVAPDNARRELVDLLRSANESIAVHQVRIDGVDDPLLVAAIDAARNGTEVEILLSSASYAASENRALVSELEALAEREDLPISASLASPRGRFDDTHVKGIVVDERHVVLGSLNWNPTAYDENREVALVLTGEEVAGYYAAVFRADARDRTIWRVPAVLAGAVLLAWLLVSIAIHRRIEWARSGVVP